MKLMPLPITILTFLGIWMPEKNFHYYNHKYVFLFFSKSAILIIFLIALCEGIVVFLQDTTSELISSLYVFLSVLGIIVKIAFTLRRRKELIDLHDVLLSALCVSKNAEEETIVRKGSLYTNYATMLLTTMATMFFLFTFAVPLLTDMYKNSQLLIDIYTITPLNKDNYFYYFTFENVSAVLSCCAIVNLDCMFFGYLLNGIAQCELLCHRLRSNFQRINHETKFIEKHLENTLKEIIDHHNLIYDFADRVNDTFLTIISTQFVLSGILLCLTIFQIAVGSGTSYELMFAAVYLGCVVSEITVFCCLGQLFTNKSEEIAYTLYDIDWTDISQRLRKMLIPMIAKAQTPIEIKGGFIIILNHESLEKIFRTSYSAYNLLRTTA